jgi:hypothetical protein
VEESTAATYSASRRRGGGEHSSDLIRVAGPALHRIVSRHHVRLVGCGYPWVEADELPAALRASSWQGCRRALARGRPSQRRGGASSR